MTPASDQQAPATGGQQDNSSNYEERYKGQVKEYNRLQQAAQAKDKAYEQLLEQHNSLKQGSSDALVQAQNEAAQAKLLLKTKEEALEQTAKAKADAEAELVGYKHKETVRKKLVEIKATDVLPFFEAGDLAINTTDEAEITARVTGFRERLSGITGTSLSGSVPPSAAPAASQQQVAGADELLSWLSDPANLRDKNYQARSEQYYNLLEKMK